MGSWSERQEVKKEVKEKEKISRETLGKFFYDLAKTSFAAMVAGGAVSFFTREGELTEIIVGIYDRNKRMIPDDVLMKVENYSDAICLG